MIRVLKGLVFVALVGFAVLLGSTLAPAEEEATDREEVVVSVRVLDDGSGRTMSGVRVVLFGSEYQPLFERETDAGGECRFTLPGGAEGAIAAFAHGRAVGHRRLYGFGLAGVRNVKLRLPLMRPVEGSVLAAQTGDPVEGAYLVLRVLEMSSGMKRLDWEILEEVETATTDAEGRFAIHRAASREDSKGSLPLTVLEVRADGFADVAKVLWNASGLPEDFVILMPEGRSVRGTVRGPDGEPVPGLEVGTGHPHTSAWVDRRLISTEDVWYSLSTLPATPAVFDLQKRVCAITDERGEYELDGLIAGREYSIRTQAEDATLRAVGSVASTHGGSPSRCDLVLRGDASLEVHVSQGKQLVEDGLLFGRAWTLKPVPEAVVELQPRASPVAYADERGVVRFEGLEPGRYRVLAAAGEVGEAEERVTLRAGDQRTVDVRLWSAGPFVEYRGRVVDDRGQPLVGNSVMVSPGGYGTHTSDDGRFTLRAPDQDDLWIRASRKDHAGRRRALAEFGDRTDINLVLPRLSPMSLSVRVPEGAREPTKHPDLSWTGWGGHLAPSAWTVDSQLLRIDAPVDPDAPWVALDAGPFRPVVWTLRAVPATPIELPTRTLDQGLTLEGTLLHADGQGVNGRRLSTGGVFELPYYDVEVYQRPHLLAPDDALRRVDATLDEHGNWRAEGLAPGRAMVNVELRYDTWLRFEVSVQADAEPLEIRLPAPATVSGRVVDKEGRPQVFATVRLYQLLPRYPSSEKPEDLMREIPTDSGGRFRFVVPPGQFRVEVVEEQSWPHKDVVLVDRGLALEPGQSCELELTLGE